MESEFLPVGSVVLLKNATRPVVVIGYMMLEEGSSEIWDYLACAYPIGVVGDQKNLLFKKEQIAKIIFKGYSDAEGNQFLKQLEESVKQIKHE